MTDPRPAVRVALFRLALPLSALLFSLVACGPQVTPAKVQCLSPNGALLRADHLPYYLDAEAACARFEASEARALETLGQVLGRAAVLEGLALTEVYVREDYSWYEGRVDEEVRGLHTCHVFPTRWRELEVGTWGAFEDYVFAHEVAHAVRPCLSGHEGWGTVAKAICDARADEYLGFSCEG